MMMDREQVAERATTVYHAISRLAARVNAPETNDICTGILLVESEMFRTMDYLVRCCNELEEENRQLAQLLDNSIGVK